MSYYDLYTKYLRELQQNGFTIIKTKRHIKIYSPKGKMFTASSSPSCPNAHKQLARDIRRYDREK